MRDKAPKIIIWGSESAENEVSGMHERKLRNHYIMR